MLSEPGAFGLMLAEKGFAETLKALYVGFVLPRTALTDPREPGR